MTDNSSIPRPGPTCEEVSGHCRRMTEALETLEGIAREHALTNTRHALRKQELHLDIKATEQVLNDVIGTMDALPKRPQDSIHQETFDGLQKRLLKADETLKTIREFCENELLPAMGEDRRLRVGAAMDMEDDAVAFRLFEKTNHAHKAAFVILEGVIHLMGVTFYTDKKISLTADFKRETGRVPYAGGDKKNAPGRG